MTPPPRRVLVVEGHFAAAPAQEVIPGAGTKSNWSDYPATRLQQLRDSFKPPKPYALAICRWPEPRRLEQQFHLYFQADRAHGEWFRPSAKLGWVIDLINSGATPRMAGGEIVRWVQDQPPLRRPSQEAAMR